MSPVLLNDLIREPVGAPAYSRPIHTSWFHIGYVTKNTVVVESYSATRAEVEVVVRFTFNSFRAEFAVEGISYLLI
jgi:hypothetical protein